MGVNKLTLIATAENDGQLTVDLTGTTGGSALTFAGNNLTDTYTLATAGGGADVIVLDANNTVANIANADVVSNFKASGADTLDSGTAAALGSISFAVGVTGVTVATFAGDLNKALATAGYALGGAGHTDVFVTTVTGSGALDGLYAIQDTNADGAVDATDFMVELTGTTGVLAATDFV